MIDKLHRDDQAKEHRPDAELNKLGAKGPQSTNEDKQAGDRLAKVSLNNAVGKPPDAADMADVMEDFREVNGDVGRGKPPSAKDNAEVMEMFREVNGDPAPATSGKAKGKGGAKAAAKSGGKSEAKPGVGKPPSAADMTDVMNDFREVNGDVGRGKPPSKEDQAEVMQMFREVNGDPAPATGAKDGAKAQPGVGKPPSAKDNAEVMEMFREVNGDPAPATNAKGNAAGGAAQNAASTAAQNAAGVGKPPSAADMADVMNDFREVNGDVGRGKPPSAKDNAEVMQMFREVNGDPAPATAEKKQDHKPQPAVASAGGAAMAAMPDVAKTPTPGGPVPIPYPNMAGAPALGAQAHVAGFDVGMTANPAAAGVGAEIKANAPGRLEAAAHVGGFDVNIAGNPQLMAHELTHAVQQTGELDPVTRMANVAIDNVEASLDETNPERKAAKAKKKQGKDEQVQAQEEPNKSHEKHAEKADAKDEAKDHAKEHEQEKDKDKAAEHDGPKSDQAQAVGAKEQTANDRLQQAAHEAQQESKANAASVVDGHHETDKKHAPNGKLEGHATNTLQAKHAPNGKLEGHATGLLVDGMHDTKQGLNHKVEGLATTALGEGMHDAKQGPNQKVDGNAAGLETDPLANQQLLHQVQPADAGGEIVGADGEKHPYNPMSGKAPAPTAKPQAGGGFQKPPAKPELPPPPQTANQQALNAFIEKARADRDAAKKSVQHQQLAKSAAVSVEANHLAAEVKKKNDQKLALIRKQADAAKEKAAQDAAAKQKNEGPVTIESLKLKLETTATEDKSTLKTEFDAKTAELKTRLDSQKQVLQEQTNKQIENYKTQQDAKKKDAEKSWNDQKASLTTTRDAVVTEIRKNVAADQTKLEKEMGKDGKLWVAAHAKMAELDKQTAANVTKTHDDGYANAATLNANAKAKANVERSAGASAAAAAMAPFLTKANDASWFEASRIRAEGSVAADAARKPHDQIARDFETKGKNDEKQTKAETDNLCKKLMDDGKRASDAVKDTATNQVKAIETKIQDLSKIADGRIKKAEDDLKEKLAAGEKTLGDTLKATDDKIAKLKEDGDKKIAELETKSLDKLQKDYDAGVKAIDARVKVAMTQLDKGSQKNIKSLEAMVNKTCDAIEQQVKTTEKQFDHTVQDADRQASQFVLQQLQKIQAEAQKALDAIDKNYEDALKTVDDAVANAHKSIEDAAKGKMLEIEVHVGTLMKDCGDSSRYDAARSQLEYYVKNKLPLPSGYGEAAPPPPSTEAKKDDAQQKPGEEKKPDDNKDAGPDAKKDEPKPALGPEMQKLQNDEEAQKKLLDPADLSPEGIDAKVKEAIKKGQKQTSVGAADDAQHSLKVSMAQASDTLTKTFHTKSDELQKLEQGDPTVLADVRKHEAAEDNGKKAAADIDAAMKKENWYGGKSPDKKAILKALEGKDAEEIEAMREELLKRGINLDDFINTKMSGAEQNEALVRMQGDPIAGDIAALQGASGHHLTGNEKLGIGIATAVVMGPLGLIGVGAVNTDQNLGADKARINEILEKYKNDPEKLKLFKEQYEKTGNSLASLLHETGNDALAKQLDPDHVDQHKPEADVRKDGQAEVDKKLAAHPELQAKTAKLDAAVDKAQQSLSFILDSSKNKGVEEALAGLTQEEAEYVKAKYKAQTGRDLERDMEKSLSGIGLSTAKASLRADKGTLKLNKLLGAEEGGWTPVTLDDDKMKAALKELKDPAERREVLEAYEKKTGRKLTDVLATKMTGNDRDIAVAYAEGDPIKAAAIEADEAANGGWMNGMHKAIHDRTKQFTGLDVDTEKFTRPLVNVMVNPVAAVESLALPDDAKVNLPGGYEMQSGAIHKVDTDKIFEIMENMPDPADRERFKQLYKERTGHDLDDDMQQKMSGVGNGIVNEGKTPKFDAYKALDDGRMDDYYAAKMDDAVDGMNDSKAFHKQLEGKSERERKAIIEAYKRRHPEDADAFNKMLGEQFGKDSLDYKKAQLLATSKDDPQTGAVKLPDEFVLQYAQDSFWNRTAKSIDGATGIFDKYPMLYALPVVGQAAGELKAASYFMRGWGVDKDAIKETLKGKSKAEIDALKAKYPELEQDLMYALDGRDAFEVKLMLEEGEPKSPEDKIKRKLKLYEFDRGKDGSVWSELGLANVSNGITDMLSPAGGQMDMHADELRKQLAILEAGGLLSPVERAKLNGALGAMDAATSGFIEARQEITGAIATAAGAIVGAVVTVVTGGAAAPLLAALATGLTTVAVKTVMLGNSYGRSELGVDLAMTVVQVATAGLGGSMGEFGKTFLGQVLNGSIGAAASNFAQTMMTSADAHDLLNLLAQASKSGLVGMLSGGANAGATAALGHAMESLSAKAFGQGAPLAGIALKGMVTGAGGSLAATFAEALVDPSTLKGDWDAVFAKLARGAAEGAFQNALNDVASTHRERIDAVHARAKAQVEAVKAGGGSVEAQQAAFAKAMSEGYEAVMHDEHVAAQKKADDAKAAASGGQTGQLEASLEKNPKPKVDEPQQQSKPEADPVVRAKEEKLANGQTADEVKQKMDEVAKHPVEEKKLAPSQGEDKAVAKTIDESQTPKSLDEAVQKKAESETAKQGVEQKAAEADALKKGGTPEEQKTATKTDEKAAVKTDEKSSSAKGEEKVLAKGEETTAAKTDEVAKKAADEKVAPAKELAPESVPKPADPVAAAGEEHHDAKKKADEAHGKVVEKAEAEVARLKAKAEDTTLAPEERAKAVDEWISAKEKLDKTKETIEKREKQREAFVEAKEHREASIEEAQMNLELALAQGDPATIAAWEKHLDQLKSSPVMTPPEGHEIMSAVAKDAVARAKTPEERAQIEASLLQVYDNIRGKPIAEIANDPVALQHLMEAHLAMHDATMNPGNDIRKVITREALEQMIRNVDRNGNATGEQMFGGFIGDSRNTQGMTPHQIVEFLGLDYSNTDYLQQGGTPGNMKGVSTIAVIDAPITPENLPQIKERAKIPMDPELVKAIKAAAEKEPPNPAAKRLMEESLLREHPINWDDPINPFVGAGMSTAGERMTGESPEAARERLKVNQEKEVSVPKGGNPKDHLLQVPEGAKLKVVLEDGREVVLATFQKDPATGKGQFVLEPDLPKVLREKYEPMQQAESALQKGDISPHERDMAVNMGPQPAHKAPLNQSPEIPSFPVHGTTPENVKQLIEIETRQMQLDNPHMTEEQARAFAQRKVNEQLLQQAAQEGAQEAQQHKEHKNEERKEAALGAVGGVADNIAGVQLADRVAPAELGTLKAGADAASALNMINEIRKNGIQGTKSAVIAEGVVAVVGQVLEHGIAHGLHAPHAAEMVSHIMDVLKAQAVIARPDFMERMGDIMKAVAAGEPRKALEVAAQLAGKVDPNFESGHNRKLIEDLLRTGGIQDPSKVYEGNGVVDLSNAPPMRDNDVVDLRSPEQRLRDEVRAEHAADLARAQEEIRSKQALVQTAGDEELPRLVKELKAAELKKEQIEETIKVKEEGRQAKREREHARQLEIDMAKLELEVAKERKDSLAIERAEARLKKAETANQMPSHAEARMRLLEDRKLTTAAAFCTQELPADYDAMRAVLLDPKNWTPERQQFHREVLERALRDALAMSSEIAKARGEGDGTPTLFAMRGNTAAGKSRSIAGGAGPHELAEGVKQTGKGGRSSGENGEELRHRAINPDNFKKEIYEHDPHLGVTSNQAHEESSIMSEWLHQALLGAKHEDGSPVDMVVDKRLAWMDEVEKLIGESKETGRRMHMIDVDAELSTSFAGVLDRDGVKDPIPPASNIAGGFEKVRANRLETIKLIAAEPTAAYQLFATTADGSKVLVAEIKPMKPGETMPGNPMERLQVVSGREALFGTVAPIDAAHLPQQAKDVSNQRITPELIDQMTADLKGEYRERMRKALERHMGKTWQEAVDYWSANAAKESQGDKK